MIATIENAAITPVFLWQRADGDFQDRSGGGSILSFGSDHFSEPLAGGCSKLVFIGAFLASRRQLPATRVTPWARFSPNVWLVIDA